MSVHEGIDAYELDLTRVQSQHKIVYKPFGGLPSLTDTIRQFLGSTAYELTNHLGNVLATVSDRHLGRAAAPGAVNHYLADILTQTDFYPFGMGMPGRTYSAGQYRYGFNGQEKDDEVHGTGNQQDYGMRIYDNRIGRFMSVDPLTNEYPELTPYQFASNTPLQAIDLDGLEAFFVAGAANDADGWNYVERFKKIFTKQGISNFTRLNVSGGKALDVSFTNTYRNSPEVGENFRTGISYSARNNSMVKKAVTDINNNIKEGQQLNLIGYSYGSVIQAYSAIELVQQGQKVNNLVLIGSPISDNSETMDILQEFERTGKIGQIIRRDIPGDYLSNPSSELDFLYGGWQNRKDSGPHFDLARPDNPDTPNVDEGKEADNRIERLAKDLKSKGVH